MGWETEGDEGEGKRESERKPGGSVIPNPAPSRSPRAVIGIRYKKKKKK